MEPVNVAIIYYSATSASISPSPAGSDSTWCLAGVNRGRVAAGAMPVPVRAVQPAEWIWRGPVLPRL